MEHVILIKIEKLIKPKFQICLQSDLSHLQMVNNFFSSFSGSVMSLSLLGAMGHV